MSTETIRHLEIHSFCKKTGKKLDKFLESPYSLNFETISHRNISIPNNVIYKIIGYAFMVHFDEGEDE